MDKTARAEECLFSSGHTACAGCGQAIGARLVLDTAGPNTIVTNATGCLEVFSTKFPESSWGVPWIHSLFENSAAVASGVEAALRHQGKIDKIRVIAQGGDGGTADIGLQALSGMMERGHDVLYVCLSPATELILGDGSIIEIGKFVDKIISEQQKGAERLLTNCEEIVQKFSFSASSEISAVSTLIAPVKEGVKNIEKAEIAPVKDKTVLSWNKKQFLPMHITSVQRRTSGDTLIKITTSSGRTLSLTPEHPVLIDTINGPRWQRADLLKIKDEVYAPRKITLNADTEKEFYIVDFLDGGIKTKLPLEIKEKINQELKRNYGSVKKAAEVLGFKYWQLKERARMVDLEGLRKIFAELPALKWDQLREEFTWFGAQGAKPVKIKEKKFTSDLLYVLGLISADGYLSDKGHEIRFINKEKLLIEEFKKRYRKIFSERKISEFRNNEDIIYLTIANPVLSILGKRLQIKSDPKELIRLPEELISAFLKGYFDGDGYCGVVKTKHSFDSKVILSTIEEKLAKRLRQMLQRIGIACFQDNRKGRFDLFISSREDIERFLNKVSSAHPLQNKKANEIKRLWKARNQRGKFFSLAPRICGRILKDICEKENVPITKFDKKRNVCSLAADVRRATKRRIRRYKEDLIKIIGEEKCNLFKEFDPYLRDDFYLDPIEKIEIVPCESKFVYDITVENTHLFIPEGAFVISNCYDNEAYMNTGIQRSGLTPFDTNTTTSPPGRKSSGNPLSKKNMVEICAAHRISYAASSSVGFPLDVQKKVKKALAIRGPKYLQVHVPCPLGWRHPSNITIDISKLAVETGLYPIVEYEYGKLVSSRKITSPRPVEEYLKPQGRFAHLFKDEKGAAEIAKIQEIANKNIEHYNLKQQ